MSKEFGVKEMAGTLPRYNQRHESPTHLLHSGNPWRSLPNLFFSQNCEKTSKEKRDLFKARRSDTLVPFSPTGLERSKSMDFTYQLASCLDLAQESNIDLSNFDLYVSKDFTDIMNISISERSDLDSMDANQELDESLDAWTELKSSQLTRSNLTEALAMRMQYSYENLDRVGKNLYKINKWFQRCSFDENEDSTKEVKTSS